MIARRRGRILNLSTVGVGVSAIPALGSSPYIVSKTAITKFTEMIAPELEQHGISVFSIDPGGVVTDMVRRAVATGAPRAGRLILEERLLTRSLTV